VSPPTVRRYRAERLLRREFEGLRARVLATVAGRLRASGVELDPSDLEACYAQAWQGLYAATLDGQEIANPAGWLVLVSFRRAIDEQRARGQCSWPPGSTPGVELEGADGGDLASELDDRVRLRQLFEGLRGHLNARERQAATLCYLQGLSRAEAAAQMGVSEGRMRKLMEGRGAGRPGVASKVGELVATIREGDWCEEQGSLMRGLAYGILDPEGERHRLAQMHREECPACRAYVLSLRGLAAVLPPALPPWGLAAAALGAARGASAGPAAPSVGGALSASGAAGAGGAAGGSWLLAGGSLSAKFAAGCLLALGVGAGCVALNAGPGDRRARAPERRSADAAARLGHRGPASGYGSGVGTPSPSALGSSATPPTVAPAQATSAAGANLEFGLESPTAAPGPRPGSELARSGASARSASSGRRSAGSEGAAAGERTPSAPPSSSQPATPPAGGSSSASAAAAQREFSPG
jgi:DNA-directed RNA polymerase specialized sigma24 family protein